MPKSRGIVMQNWESRNFIHNATSDQVRAAVLFLHKWIAKNLSEDAVRVTSLDNENHNHYTVDVIAPNHALSLPIYIGVNCSANQLSNQGIIIKSLIMFLGNPSAYAEIEDDAASEEAIQADTKWFMRVADAIVSKVSHKHQIAKMRADLSL